MAYSSEVLADSPLAYWRMDDASSAAMVDSSGNGHNGAAYAGTFSLGASSLLAGDSNPSVDFSAGNAGAVGAAWMSSPTAVTFECLINPDTVSGGSYNFIGVRDDNNGTGNLWWLVLKATKLTALCRGSEFSGATTITAGNTYHVAFTYDGTTAKVYVNGALDGSASRTGSMSTANLDLLIGRWGNSGSPLYFDGRIDEVAYYGSALSGARILAHYNAAQGAASSSATGSLTLGGSAGAAARGTATGTLTLAGSGTLSEIATGTAALALSAASSARANSAASGSLTLSGSAGASVTASATAHLDLTGVAEATQLYGTDTSNAYTGLSMGGLGLVFVTQTPEEPPFPLGPQRVEKAIAFPRPTLVKGRPAFDNTVVAKLAQRDQVFMDGREITWFRADAPGDTPILVPGHELTEPFGYGASDPLVIKRTHFTEEPGVGDLSFLFEGARVQYRRVDEDGHVIDYRGIVFALRPSQREWVAEVVGEVSGRASQILIQHPLVRKVFDIGALVKFEAQGLGLHLHPHNGPHTGLRYPQFGGMSLQSYFQRLGALSRTKHTQARALMPKVWGQATWEFAEIDKDTVHFTIYPDGVRIDLSGLVDDLTEKPNTIFGNGVTPEGLHWANNKYPGYFTDAQPYPYTDTSTTFGVDTTDADTDSGTGITTLVFKLAWLDYLPDDLSALTTYTSDVADAVDKLKEDAGLPQDGVMNSQAWAALYDTDVVGYNPQGARKFPIAQDPKVNAFLYSANGSIIGRNPNWVQGTIRVDREYDYGIAEKSAGINHARSVIRLASGHQWFGDINLNDIAVFSGNRSASDAATLTPADMMRARDIRPGMNGKILYFDGSSTKVHVSGASISAPDESGARSITLTADTGGRDFFDLAAALERNQETARSPYREWVSQNRSNRPVRNMVERDEWFGRYPKTVQLRGGHWNEIPVIMGQSGVVNETKLQLTVPTTFAYLVATRELFGLWMDNNFGNPWVLDGDNRTVFEQDFAQDLFDDATILTVQGAGIQRCGFGWRHGYNAEGDRIVANPVTGTVVDRQPWGYVTQSGKLPVVWLSIYPEADCAITQGRWFSALQDDLT